MRYKLSYNPQEGTYRILRLVQSSSSGAQWVMSSHIARGLESARELAKAAVLLNGVPDAYREVGIGALEQVYGE